MKINNRERILLLVLVLAVAGYLFYSFVYTKNIEKIQALNQQVDEKSKMANELMSALDKEKELNFDFKALNFEISDMSVTFLEKINQENVIIFFNKYFDNFGLDVKNISFTPVGLTSISYNPGVVKNANENYPLLLLKDQYFESQVSDDILNTDAAGSATAESMQVSFDFKADYYDLMDFIDSLQQNQINFVMSSINMSSDLDNAITGNLQISFYSIPKLHDHENIEWVWNDIMKFGRANPFYLDDVVLNPYWTTKYDFNMDIKPIQSDSPTVSLGLFNDKAFNSYVYADNNDMENVELQFKQEEDKYYYKYKTLLGSYPEDYQYWVEFTPVNEFISMEIVSNARTSEQDLSGVNLTVINTTDKLFYINIFSDDLVRPRLNLETTDNVIIKNN